jgi:hypothetical protein
MTMQRSQYLPLVLALAGLSAVGPRAAELLLKPVEQQKLGAAVGDYFKALGEEKDIEESFEVVEEERSKVQKRLAKELPEGDVLALVEDWEKILDAASEVDDRGAKKGKPEPRVYKDERFGDYSIAVSTPAKYSAKTGPYPLVICLPPKGKKAMEHLGEQWIDAAAREAAIIAVCDMPANDRMWGGMGTPESHGGIDTVLLTVKSIKSTHAIDVDRIFLAGFGESVAAAARIAGYYPHVFAGVIGRAGDLDDLPPTNFRNLPTFFAGGGEKCTTFQTKAKEEGFENVTLNAAATEADVWAWVQATQRSANPLDVSLSPLQEYNLQAYWLKVAGVDPAGSKIRARVDRAANTITIESSGISTATLFFNDLIVDLSKPVKVVCNGTPSEDFIPRNLRTMLDIAYSSGDSGRVYVNSHSYDIPVAK